MIIKSFDFSVRGDTGYWDCRMEIVSSRCLVGRGIRCLELFAVERLAPTGLSDRKNQPLYVFCFRSRDPGRIPERYRHFFRRGRLRLVEDFLRENFDTIYSKMLAIQPEETWRKS